MASLSAVMRNAVTSIENTFTTNPLIDQATTDDDKPTPFYIYQELIKLTFQGGATCERLLYHLLNKLQSPRPSIKLKSLLVMEHLLRKGHPHFQSTAQKEVAKLRPCLDFRGPADPIHGEQPYIFVREKAALLLNLVYETRTDARLELDQTPQGLSSPSSPTTAKTMQGFGGDSRGFGSSNSRGFASSNGFGSNGSSDSGSAPRADFGRGATSMESSYRKPADNSINLDKMKNFISNSVDSLKNIVGTTEAPEVSDNGTYRSPLNTSTLNTVLPPGAAPASHSHSHSSAGAGWNASNHTITSIESAFPVEAQHAAGVVGGSWADGPAAKSAVARPSSGREGRIVDEICNPAGIKLAPSRLQLSQFIQSTRDCENIDQLCYLLAENLADPNWKKRLKALYAIHELINNNIARSKEYFTGEGLASIVALRVSVQQSVREKAVQILQQIAPESLNAPSIPTTQHEEVAVQTPEDSVVKSLFESLQQQQPQQPQQPLQQQPQQSQQPQFQAFQQQQPTQAQQPELLFSNNTASVDSSLLSSASSTGSGINLLGDFLTPTIKEEKKSDAPSLSFAEAYGSSSTQPAASDPFSQLSDVFNDSHNKPAILDVTPQPYPTTYQQPYVYSYGMPVQGVPVQAYGYPQAYGGYTSSPTASGPGGFSFVSASTPAKDPFDFGDLSKLASNM
eukprot:TRINITY_DN3027_c0_g1_i1.p1 TRINITY_DN3027_c0_g1~~TRINITY_DN3027_c0_g1_i1.p1  ORF type:complete len:688 (-),score=171.46 TRINITY_DN3027_c0_g1_i1:59-2098(-)